MSPRSAVPDKVCLDACNWFELRKGGLPQLSSRAVGTSCRLGVLKVVSLMSMFIFILIFNSSPYAVVGPLF